MPSPSSRKLVVRFNFWCDPAMEERFAREPDIELRTCDLQGPRRRLVRSCRSARLSDRRGTGRAAATVVRHGRLLERCPSLLCVSSIGAATTRSMSPPARRPVSWS